MAWPALHYAGRWLWIAATKLEAITAQRPPSPEGHLVLAAAPANLPPQHRPITGQQTVPQLCDEVIVATERLRFAAATFTDRAPWSAHATSQSWRRDALASAITGRCSELILDTLAHRAAGLGLDSAVQAHLHHAADATPHAWMAWRAVAMEWDLLSTGTNRRGGLSRVATEADDLVLRLAILSR
jgi:hypothetical protein